MKRHSPPMTRERAAIAKHLVLTKGWLQHQAAAFLKVNQGRISEVINGKRFAEVPPAASAKPIQGSLELD